MIIFATSSELLLLSKKLKKKVKKNQNKQLIENYFNKVKGTVPWLDTSWPYCARDHMSKHKKYPADSQTI